MKNLLFLLFPLSFFACQQDSAMFSKEMTTPVNYETENTSQGIPQTTQQTTANNGNGAAEFANRKIIKTANLRYQVEDLENVSRQVDSLSLASGGYVASMSQNNDQYTFRNQLVMKVPAEHFSRVLQELNKQSIYLDHKVVNAQDVSEEFVDISARIKTKKAVRDRYTEVLRSKARNVEEILNAENQIRIIQEEIESIESRIQYLSSQSSMSTINLAIYQKVEFVKPPEVYGKTYFAKIGESFSIGKNILERLSLFLIALWPLIMLGVPFYIFRKNIFRKVRRGTE